MTTSVVNLERLTEFTSNYFIAMLRRFISRRGQHTNNFSYNGRLTDIGTFIQSNINQLIERIASMRIQCHLISAFDPIMGRMRSSCESEETSSVTRVSHYTCYITGPYNRSRGNIKLQSVLTFVKWSG